MRVVPLDRPPRPRAGAVTDPLRSAILRRAHEQLGLNAPKLLSLHTEAEYLADTRDLLADVGQRYKLGGTLYARVLLRLTGGVAGAFTYGAATPPDVYSDKGAGFILLELPDTEFLTAIENAVELGYRTRVFGGGDNFSGNDEGHPLAEDFFAYADQALAAHGAPYRQTIDTWRFEWIGDPKQHELTIQPALRALEDPRLQGRTS